MYTKKGFVTNRRNASLLQTASSKIAAIITTVLTYITTTLLAHTIITLIAHTLRLLTLCLASSAENTKLPISDTSPARKKGIISIGEDGNAHLNEMSDMGNVSDFDDDQASTTSEELGDEDLSYLPRSNAECRILTNSTLMISPATKEVYMRERLDWNEDVTQWWNRTNRVRFIQEYNRKKCEEGGRKNYPGLDWSYAD